MRRPVDFVEAVDILQKGGIVILPTETIYGMFTKIAIDEIFEIKRRPSTLQLAYYSNDMPEWLTTHRKWHILRNYIPGPVCIIWEGQSYRFSSNPTLRRILDEVKYLYGTSANLHGELSATNINMIKLKLPYINEGSTKFGYESTIIDLSNNLILRNGIIDLRDHFTDISTNKLSLIRFPKNRTIFNNVLMVNKSSIFKNFYYYLYVYGAAGIDYIEVEDEYTEYVLNRAINSMLK